MTEIKVPRRPVLLIILDGVGCNPDPKNNAVVEANTPILDRHFADHPFTTLDASGAAVGLPDGQMGNSEVGHMTIGCGKILLQDLVRIDHAIETGLFFQNPIFLDAAREAKRLNRPLHLVGLVSDGGVHSHIRHLQALITFCAEQQIIPNLHVITDGRDTAPRSAMAFIEQLQPYLKQAKGKIATVSGRYYSMDRDKRWDRIEKAWRCMCFSEGEHADSALQAIENAYERGVNDEFILPTFIEGGETLQQNDPVIFFNFRNDRARQLTYTLAGKDFKPFDRGDFSALNVSCLTEYDPLLSLPIAFPPDFPTNTLAETISKQNIRQLHCAETEKYAHVTFFFNGGRESAMPGEDRQMIPSPNVATYDLAPKMAAKELSDELIQALEQQKYGFIVVNYANGDMVGHTAVREAVIEAVETLDKEMERVLPLAREKGYSVILTADHGNCDEMVDPVTGQPHTQHTTHPVPCLILDDEVKTLKPGCGLSHIAPTVLKLMGLNIPESMVDKDIIAS